jgi:predicted N-acetyltransferase YhbS
VYAIKTEKKADYWEVEALFDLCFAPGREALSSYRLRENSRPISELCMVARDKEQILAGAVRYWPVKIQEYKALLLGPIAVHPTRQGEGLGSLLIKDSLELAKELDYSRVILIGDFPYYGRLGFKKLTNIRMPQPTNPDRVLGIELVTGAWSVPSGSVKSSN